MDPAPAPATIPSPGSLPASPPAVLLDRSRPCVHCTYDLFRQPLDGKCPECGTDVAVSLQARYLRDAGPDYLRALHQGMNLIVAIVGVALLALGVQLAVLYVMKFAVSWRTSVIFQALLDLGFLAATWRLTVADPGHPRPLPRWGARAVVLSLAITQIGLTSYVIAHRLDPSGRITQTDAQGLWTWLIIVTALEAAGTIAFGFTIAGLARRLPSPGLARGMRLASVGLFLALLAALASSAMFLAWMYERVSYKTALQVSRLLEWPENTGRVASGVAAAVLLWTFSRRLRAEAAEAGEARD